MNAIDNKDELLFSKALIFAAEKHAGQVRKDRFTPYIYHPVHVARLIHDAGYNIRYQIAGLFHDLLEDTDATEEAIREYGSDILAAVKLVSKNYSPTHYIEDIQMHHMASVVKNADRIDNLIDAASADVSFQRRYLKDSEKYAYLFSEALDLAILNLQAVLDGSKKATANLSFTQDQLKLYVDRDVADGTSEVEGNGGCSINATDQPDRQAPDFSYLEADSDYYCTSNGKTWIFSECAWKPIEIDLVKTYGYDIGSIDRECVLDEFRYRKEQGKMLDFVVEENL